MPAGTVPIRKKQEPLPRLLLFLRMGFSLLAVAEGDVVRAVTDYIAGMTDRYATRVYQDLFIPQPAFFSSACKSI